MKATLPTYEQIADWFSYHAPNAQEIAVMQRWREAVTNVAADFVAETQGPDQTIALRKLKDALMSMNAALICPMPKNR